MSIGTNNVRTVEKEFIKTGTAGVQKEGIVNQFLVS
jgi:hypothetical protein